MSLRTQMLLILLFLLSLVSIGSLTVLVLDK